MMRTFFSRISRGYFAPMMRFPHTATLGLEILEDRTVPAGFFLTGVGGFTNPAEPNVRLYDSTSNEADSFVQAPGDLVAFPGGFAGSVRVANGDVNGDGIDDLISSEGPGEGSGSLVKIFDGKSLLFNGQRVEIASFYAYSNSAGASQNFGFGGGVFVASADFNFDGFDELVVSAGAGARGHIKVFNFNGLGSGFLGSAPELRSSFFAYTDFAGEIRVTTLQIGSTAYLVTASGAGTTPSDIRVYGGAYNIGEVADLTFVQPAAQSFPFPGYSGGVSIAAGDTNGDRIDELFVSTNSETSTVFVFDIFDLTAPKYSFEAFPGFTGEVRLGASDVDGDGKVEVLTSTGSSPGAAGAHVKAWSVAGVSPVELRSFFAYPGYSNGVFLSTNDFTIIQSFSNTTPLTIPDDGQFVYSFIQVDTRTFNRNVIRPKGLRIVVNLTGTTGFGRGDLQEYLASPSAAYVQVQGGSGTNDLVVPNVIEGTWTLAIRDIVPGENFRLDSWTIRLVY